MKSQKRLENNKLKLKKALKALKKVMDYQTKQKLIIPKKRACT
jgi:hypothetical protein